MSWILSALYDPSAGPHGALMGHLARNNPHWQHAPVGDALVILRGPDPARDGCRDWTLPALCGWIEERFDERLHPASLSRVVRGLDLSRQKTRPVHPRADPKAQAAFVKGGSQAP